MLFLFNDSITNEQAILPRVTLI